MIFKENKKNGSTLFEKPTYGTTVLNPLNIIKKNDSEKIVLDARHLNSDTDPLSKSWPLEPLATQFVRAKKKNK